MRISLRGFFLALILTPCLCSSSNAQSAGRIKSMKLLAADTEWVSTDLKLFWTTSGGAQWKEITPKLNHKRQTVSSVFFLDSSTGWVLMHCADDLDPIADDVCFEFASTADAGENWSIVRPKIVDPFPHSAITEDLQGFSDATFLNFSDPHHGWAVLVRNLHVEVSPGEMLRTTDGGRTWRQLAKGTLPIARNLYFLNGKDGWMAGGPDHELYVTHDAGSIWQKVSLAKPASVGPDRNGDVTSTTCLLVLCGYLTYKATTMEDATEGPVPSHDRVAGKTTVGWQIVWFLLHVATVYTIVNFCTAWLAGWTRERILPHLQIRTTSSSQFEFLFSHLLTFSFVPAFLAGLINSRFKHRVAQFVWLIPTAILGYKLATFSAPSVFQSQLSAAFHQYFGGGFLIGEFRNWHDLWSIAGSNSDMTRGLTQMTFTAPFYAGVGYSLAAWIGLRTELHRKVSEKVNAREQSRFGQDS